MSPRHSAIEPRLNTVTTWLTPAIVLLNDLHDGFGTPFLQTISSISLSLINVVQNVKRNQDDCIELIEKIPQILYGIADLHLTSEVKGVLLPAALDNVGNFNSINEMKRQTEIMQTEIMELISTFSEHTISDSSSSIYQRVNESQVSSNSLSMLPSRPKIFYGRELELQEIVTNLALGSARIAILGAGGMGKTSLARAALHHPEVTAKYAHQIFVAADSVTDKVGLVTLIASHIGLKPTPYLTKRVIQYFSEYFEHLALVITMRGAQQPAQVYWTRPFLLPLKPISDHAAWQTFMDITDDPHNSEDVTQLLSFTNNIPLAVDLMAHLVDYEGCSSVLTRWETEKTSILSSGYGKSSNLDASISVSLLSPRMAASHGARELLALLAILPDGLSDVEIIQSQIPAKDILACKSVLLSTSLAYTDDARLKVLVPVREYMQQHYPASQSFIQSPSNPRLEVFMIAFLFDMWWLHIIPNVEQWLSKAETNLDSFDDPVVKCRFYSYVGDYFSNHDNIPRARQFFHTALELAVMSKNIRQECHVVHKIANCELHARNWLAAQSNAQRSQKLASEVQEIYMQIKNATSDQKPSIMHSVAVVNIAEIAIIRGENLDHIEQVLTDQKKIFATMHFSSGVPMCDLVMAESHFHKGHNTLAAQALLLQYAQSVDIAVRSYSLERLANLKNWGITAIGWVPQWTTVSLAYAFKCQNNVAVHKALSSMGHILLAFGDLNTAQSLFIVALEGFTWMDVHRSRAECMLHLCEISHQKGDFEEAISSFKAARPLFERSFQVKDVKHVDSLVRGLEEEIEQGHNTKVTYLSTLNVPTQDIVRLAAEMEDGSANPV
ncbi:hypothetical protein B0H14DRAFT_2561678 [Mycena olivaceomarginata]|nr:hypothetical protein B0H14DRAFT_2561678 [Mycena olivaceomarginata]